MARFSLIFPCVLLVAGIAYCPVQVQTATVAPPHCVCPTPSASSTHDMHGDPHGKMDHHICGSDGKNYTTPCDLVNAQFQNRNLGKRPCMKSGQKPSTMRPGHADHNDDHHTEQHSFCMTNGRTMTATQMSLDQQMMTDTTLAVRCKGSCPCAALTCPTMHGDDDDEDDEDDADDHHGSVSHH